MKKKYWKSIEQTKNNNLELHKEFSDKIPIEKIIDNKNNFTASRRDFLKLVGFSTVAATITSCETPITESVPYLVKPEEITPGNANYYATTFDDGYDFASVLIKTREGRPIKIDPNYEARSLYDANSRIQSSLLSLYDSYRLKSPVNQKSKELNISLEDYFRNLNFDLSSNKKTVFLTSSFTSPSLNNIIKDLKLKYPNFEIIFYDPISYSGLLDSYDEMFGVRALPNYRFEKADFIISIGADFLGEWLNFDHSEGYASKRDPDNKMSQHIHFESNMSLSGSNADKRYIIKPSEKVSVLTNLYNIIAKSFGEKQINSQSCKYDAEIKLLAAKLIRSKGKSIVLIDSSDKNLQNLCFKLNMLLGNINKTINIAEPLFIKKGDDNKFNILLNEMLEGKVESLIINDVNLFYNFYDQNKLKKSFKKVNVITQLTLKENETSPFVDYIIPKNHFLESWGDSNPKNGMYTLRQPVINPLFDSIQVEDFLLKLLGNSKNYKDYLKSFWKKSILQSTTNWNQVLHDGFYFSKQKLIINVKNNLDINYTSKNIWLNHSDGGLELLLFANHLGDGKMANIPWLQELPDPINRTCWDNYLCISKNLADNLGLKNKISADGQLDGDIVTIKSGKLELSNIPVFIQPGHSDDTVSLSFGYGRTKSGKSGDNVGVNAFIFYKNFISEYSGIEIIKQETSPHKFASVQLAHTMMGRDIVKEATLKEYKKDKFAGNHPENLHTPEGMKHVENISLWKQHDYNDGHLWNLAIDLNKCTGCGACVTACHIENNVPVVGKSEIRKHRDMHWLRIDRYYSSDMTMEKAESLNEDDNPNNDIGLVKKYKLMEEPSQNPEVVFQPVMCQHCNNAPCETVCPVAATSHSKEGLNHMAYNRCVGTRYCANNCPYKVRRFNWFNYKDNDDFDFNMNDDLGKLVLNPDVTVRARGVMEKCSFCIQNIQKAKLDAKKENRKVKDGDVKIACENACTTGAMVFGDVNDKSSKVHKEKQHERSYNLLASVGTRPNVFYKTKIRNKKDVS
tara:strand:- start:9466 stop:12528 length:3063 start_codon:yes stop_codon:yes gene_type:complete